MAVARSLHARPHERCEILCAACADRGSDGRPDRRRSRRIEGRGLRTGRQGARAARLAALRHRESQGPDQDRPETRAGLVLPRPARHARHDGVVRAVRHRPAQGRRDGGRVGGVGRGRQRGRPARENHRLPRGRHRRRQDQVRLRGAGTRLRRLRRLQGGQSAAGPAHALPQGRGRPLRECRRCRSSIRCCAS